MSSLTASKSNFLEESILFSRINVTRDQAIIKFDYVQAEEEIAIKSEWLFVNTSQRRKCYWLTLFA